MALPLIKKFHHTLLTVTMADISAASSVFIPLSFRGKVVGGKVAIANAITTADSALTAKITGTAITGFTGTAAFTSSAAGTVFTMADPTGANFFVDGDVLELITDGASSTTAIATWTITLHTF
jgi:hypothetical protein